MYFPLQKVFVFTLTLAGLIFSVNGFDILSQLRDAVLSAESFVGDIFKNVVQVVQHFRTFNDVFEAAVEEHCVFRCPNDAEPKANRNHKPTANGCGALGLKIKSDYLPITEMTKCCDRHDICYDTCRNEKENCDVEFRKCLYNYCESYKQMLGGGAMVKGEYPPVTVAYTCKGAAKMLFTGTLTFGCKAYLDAQSKACFCPSYGWKDNRNKYTGSDHQEL